MQNSVVPINLNPQNAENQENAETQESYLLKMTKLGIKVNKISFLQLSATFLLLLGQMIIYITKDQYDFVIPFITPVVLFFNFVNLLVSPILIFKKLSLYLLKCCILENP